MAVDNYVHHLASVGPGKPLLFLFHGTGGDERQLLQLGAELAPGAGLVSPRGDVNEQGAARFFRRTGEGVYDMDDLARATGRMRDFVAAHVEREKPSAVLGLGYSNGANILASVAFAAPQLFDAAVLMHPLIPFEPDWGEGAVMTRFLVTAGRHDPICPEKLTARLLSYLEAAGADTQIEWHTGGHELRPGEVTAAGRFLAPFLARGKDEA
ncbi:alpha/beta hydrolase [Nitratireductor aquimarinus]|uniref:alpha/beta hydrolase n=1 Tax=Alphaproteobacteria TaxID=28211 RepID=UPI0019D3F691|nr:MULTISPECIES: alpha/beta hydrolase [Alphaproteobacteria]MBY6022780.1 alpha/beta hydrolase [Nitratireductor sp. DP7N14-4]MBN7757988.1 alpha/beta hydrolase [Nitratireductor aquimarinus]MBY6000750.1 alpha/beta hydrolase [Tritonibacter mobilis]MCV0352513.1 alpha/beta hydrolase [Nitratireductor sp.]MCV0381588.1 alpha/beta hydrolase [Nitratireductor sp.]